MRILYFIILSFTASIGFTQNQNIEIYCKVFGVCKYYSNNDIDWDGVFFEHYSTLTKNSLNSIEFNNLLSTLLNKTNLNFSQANDTSISTTTLLHKWGINDVENHFLKTNFEWISTNSNINTWNKKCLIQLLKSYKKRRQLTTTTKNQRKVIVHDKEIIYDKFDEKIALLSLFRLYNVIEYYYPYKHLLDTPWDKVLKKVVPIFLTCHNKEEYTNNIKLLTSYLDDSHVFIEAPSSSLREKREDKEKNITKMKYPMGFDFAEGKLFIFNVLNDSISNYYSIKKGDQIISINGKNIDSLLNEASFYYSSSNHESLINDFCTGVHFKDSLSLTVIQKEDTNTLLIHKVELNYSDFVKMLGYHNTNNISKEISDSIGYLYMPETKYSKINKILNKYKNKKVLILDCRGYGSLAVLKLPKFLSKTPKNVATYLYPDYRIPGVFRKNNKNETYYISNSMDLGLKIILGYKVKLFPTFKQPFKGRLYVLIDEHAMSFGETVIMLIKSYRKDATLIGRPTNGANGNVTSMVLPLGEKVYYTGIDFRFSDDTELQRIGIQPDIVVYKTVNEIISGKDIILETAIDYAEGTNHK